VTWIPKSPRSKRNQGAGGQAGDDVRVAEWEGEAGVGVKLLTHFFDRLKEAFT